MCETGIWEGDAIFLLCVPVVAGTVGECGLLGSFLSVRGPSIAMGATAMSPSNAGF